ncbi:metallophosphoesterase [uncultured Proteiniphilum sp.]|uniref:metallophosphoesterase n=1 Tax=uncultured Proteiniphilum sp. TaxID=497637 RepID=UPI002618A43B|nr:metallophosphoesterase [uncultured Proteiniphilum sp.]
MRALINAFIIHLTLNILVFLKGWHAFEGKKGARIVMTVIFGGELLVYSAGFIFHRHIPEAVIQFIWVMGTSWMLFLLYSGGLWLLIDLIYVARKKLTRRPWRIKARRFKIISFIIPIVIVAGIMGHGRFRFMHPVVQQLPVIVNKPGGTIDSVRIAMIGDLHLGYMIDRKHTKRFVDLIMAQHPDLILFVGDILDTHIEPILQQGMDEELSRLYAPLGVFSCTGNHEYRYEAEEKIALLNKAGIIMLRDSAVLIDSSFYVVGREDKIMPTRKPLQAILTDDSVEMSRPVIVLNHTPDNLAEEADAGVDIALYGHTHHGQVFPGNIATELVFEVAHGYKKKGNTHVYVTSGIGLVGPQYRIGTVSEMVMLTVRFRQ